MKTTESASHYHNLESMSVRELLTNINREDMGVPKAIEKIIPKKISDKQNEEGNEKTNRNNKTNEIKLKKK